MAVYAGPDIVENGLVLSIDSSNNKSFSGEIFYNLIDSQTLGNPSWANGANQLTILSVIKILGNDQQYAYTPISKWGTTLENTSFALYHFQNYLGTSPFWTNRLLWFAGANNVWGGISDSFQATPNTTYFVGLQYNATLGGQLWINNSKIGSRGISGTLGSANNSIVIDGNVSGRSGIHKVEMVKMYNRELQDSEILQMYEVFKHKL
jgi:hypothetical protein